MDSYFGPGVKLVGTLWAKGTVHFEAEFEGEIFASEYFIVGKNGRIFGDIKTYNILNMGKVQGNINAENKVSLADKSSLIGDITTFHLVISEGSNFEGSCKMIDAPPKALKDEAALPEPQPAPEPQKKSEPAKKIQAKTKLVLSCLALVAVGFGFFYPKESVNRQDGFADKAYAFLEEKKYDDAEAEFKRALKVDKKNPEIYAGLGEVYLKQNQLNEAERQFRRAIELNPSHSAFHLQLAKTLVAGGRVNEGRDAFQTVIDIDPTNAQAFYYLGSLQAKEEETADKAVANLEMAVKLDPDFYGSHKVLSDLYAEMGDRERALREIREAIRLKEDDPAFRLALADLLFKNNREEDAMEEWLKMTELFPQNLQARMRLGDWYFQKGALQESLEQYKAAKSIAPKNPEVHAQVGRIYMGKKETQRAIEAFRDAVNLDSGDGEVYAQLGRMLAAEEKWDEALEALESAIDLKQDSGEIHFEMGEIFLAKEMPKQAAEEFRKSLKRNPGNILYHRVLAETLATQKKLDPAINVLQTAAKLEPKNAEIFFDLCKVYSKKFYYTAAIGHCKKAVELRSDYYDAMNRLAWLYAKKRMNLDEAAKLSSQTLAKFPQRTQYIDTLSEIYYVKGDVEGAVASIQTAIQLAPDTPYYKQQLWKFKNIKLKPLDPVKQFP